MRPDIWDNNMNFVINGAGYTVSNGWHDEFVGWAGGSVWHYNILLDGAIQHIYYLIDMYGFGRCVWIRLGETPNPRHWGIPVDVQWLPALQ